MGGNRQTFSTDKPDDSASVRNQRSVGVEIQCHKTEIRPTGQQRIKTSIIHQSLTRHTDHSCQLRGQRDFSFVVEKFIVRLLWLFPTNEDSGERIMQINSH